MCFAQRGLTGGDIVILSLQRDTHVAVFFLTLLKLGLVAIVLEPHTTSHELKSVLHTVSVDALVADQETLDVWQADGFLPKLKCLLPVSSIKGGRFFSSLLNRNSADTAGAYPSILDHCEGEASFDAPRASDVALMLPTSGTIGGSKLVQLTYGNLLSQVETLRHQLRLSESAVVLSVLPTSHIDGLVNGILLSFLSGSSLYTTKCSPQSIPEILDIIGRHVISHVLLTPTVMALITQFGGSLEKTFAARGFEFFISSGAHLPRTLWEQFEASTGRPVVNFYGLTEANNVIFCGPDETTRKVGTLGKPVNCEIRVVDEGQRDLGAGQCGQLLLRGDMVMAGYANQPHQTLEALEDGWLRTGDLVRLDEDGFVEFVGRAKNVVISGGLNVYPEEVNDALLAHPAISEAVTFGLPHDLWGETVASCVTLDGEAGLEEAEIIAFLRARLSDYKVPKLVQVWSALPKGRSGKVNVAEIRMDVERCQSGKVSATSKSRDGVARDVLSIASQSFKVPVSQLDLEVSHSQVEGWDSLQHLSFITKLEEHFKVEFKPLDIVETRTLGQAVTIINTKLSS